MGPAEMKHPLDGLSPELVQYLNSRNEFMGRGAEKIKRTIE